MSGRSLALIVLGVVLAGLLTRAPAADAQGPVAVVIDGPTAVAPGTTHEYTITVTGGPAEDNGTFEIRFQLQGENLEGGDPTIERTLNNREGVFLANVTAPNAEGTVALLVRAKSGGATGNETTQTSLSIEVFRPVELRATIRNNGAAAALNVTVRFYVDGAAVGTTTLARIDAGGTAEASVSYVPVGLGEGRHVVRIEADMDGDGVIGAGEVQEQDFFYKAAPSNTPAILGTITAVLLAFLVLLLLAIRRQRRQG